MLPFVSIAVSPESSFSSPGAEAASDAENALSVGSIRLILVLVPSR